MLELNLTQMGDFIYVIYVAYLVRSICLLFPLVDVQTKLQTFWGSI